MNSLETLRSTFYQIESLEKALGEAIAYKQKFPRDQVICDMLISKFVKEIHNKSNTISLTTDSKESSDWQAF